jgi:ataxin-10
MLHKSELQLLDHILKYFVTSVGNAEFLIEDLGEIVRMTSMMMSNDHMWDYTAELSKNLEIWAKLDESMNIILSKENYTMNELRIVKGIVLLIRNLAIAYKESKDDIAEFTNQHIKRVIDLSVHLSKLYENEKNSEICFKSLDISIVCFHCVFNFIYSIEKKDPIFVKSCVNVLNIVLTQMENIGNIQEVKQILPQFKAFCMIDETREEIVNSGCTVFINLLKAMSRILNITVETNIETLNESESDEYRLILLFAHSLTYLFNDEKIGIAAYKLEKSETSSNSVLLYLIACQMTFSVQNAYEKWDYVAIGAVILDFFQIYTDKCTNLLQDTEIKPELKIYHRKTIALLDIISNLLPHELFKKTLTSYDFLKRLIQFFHIVELNTERKRLKDDNTTSLNKKPFGHIKTIIIEIITYLVHNDTNNQNIVRENGGLILILNNCNLDVNEPFIRERCILCLKYVLENNQENQRFVASLEAKGIEFNKETENVLEKAGYEVEIVDGKVQLKNKGQNSEKIGEI